MAPKAPKLNELRNEIRDNLFVDAEVQAKVDQLIEVTENFTIRYTIRNDFAKGMGGAPRPRSLQGRNATGRGNLIRRPSRWQCSLVPDCAAPHARSTGGKGRNFSCENVAFTRALGGTLLKREGRSELRH